MVIEKLDHCKWLVSQGSLTRQATGFLLLFERFPLQIPIAA
jgi:hypothetical protein